MGIIIGKTVSLSYYSGMHAFYSKVLFVEGKKIGVEMNPQFLKVKFIEGDPIVLVYESENEIFTCECLIDEMDLEMKKMFVKIEHEQAIQNSRIFERFPVSLYASIHAATTKKKVTAIIKNISMTGIAIIAKKELKLNDEVNIDLYLDERVVGFKGCVVRAQKSGNKCEFGVRTEYPDYSVKNTIRLYLEILKNEQNLNGIKTEM